MSRERVVSKIEWDESAQVISMAFEGASTETFNIGALPDDIKVSLLLHGAQQRLSDVFAGRLQKKWTTADCATASRKLYDHMAAGEWGAKRGTSEGPSNLLVVEALARVTNKPLDAVKTKWSTLDIETRKGVSANPQIQEMVATIRLERAKAKAAEAPAVDLTKILG